MSSDLKRVFLANGLMEAEVIKGKLESFGIPVLLRYESIGVVYGLTVEGLGQVEVLVPTERAAEARGLLAEELPPDESA